MKKDIYQEVTDRIVAQLEQGVIPWHKPWIISGKGCAISRSTGKAYSLLNQLILGKPGEYLTYAQCVKEGGHIRKGEKASMVVFWKWVEQKDEEIDEVKKIPFLRHFSVFHIDQCEGINPKLELPAAEQTLDSDAAADAIIADYLQ